METYDSADYDKGTGACSGRPASNRAGRTVTHASHSHQRGRSCRFDQQESASQGGRPSRHHDGDRSRRQGPNEDSGRAGRRNEGSRQPAGRGSRSRHPGMPGDDDHDESSGSSGGSGDGDRRTTGEFTGRQDPSSQLPAQDPRPSGHGRKRKEQDRVFLPALPRNAAQCKVWLGAAVSAITSAAYDPDTAMPWIFEAIRPQRSFVDLADTAGEATLDDKLRTALCTLAASQESAKCADLTAEMHKETDRMWHMEPARQIRGRQLLHVIRSFYEVKASKRDTFELKHLHEMKFWGDQNLSAWKLHWDDMVEHQRVKPSSEQLEDMYLEMCRQSDALRPHVEHYERCDDEHPDHSYEFLERMTMRVIKARRGSKNLESLVAGTHVAHKHVSTPGVEAGAGQGADADKHDKGGKGPKDNKGGKAGAASPTGGSSGQGGKTYDPTRSCLENFFSKCKHGAVLGKGVKCEYGTHRKTPRDEDRERPFFKRLEGKYGSWESGKFRYPTDSAAAPATLEDSPPGFPQNGK